jgi:hypothetical protein
MQSAKLVEVEKVDTMDDTIPVHRRSNRTTCPNAETQTAMFRPYKLVSLLSILFGILPLSDGFSIFSPSGSRIPLTGKRPITSLYAVKRKMSMAAKNKRRQAKQQRAPDLQENLSPSELDFKSSKKEENAPLRVQDPGEAANQAKELLKAQRESVDMLTRVRERVENLPVEEISKALESPDGYFVVDDFLNDQNILDRLYQESTSMYQEEQMETDASNLGSGEYIANIQGGKEQYVYCPRLVEAVVSTTKHVPEVMKSMSLDASACMATLRMFDRAALKASLVLLTGEADDDLLEQNPRQFSKIVTEPNDKRRLSLQYYILPEKWDASLGGGLEFEAPGSVAAKRDRLVIWKSDATMYRKQPWKGNDEQSLGGCIELHLVGA